MSLNCAECPTHCCGRLNVGAPILTPAETLLFDRDEVDPIPGTSLFRLKRGPDGNCVFFSHGRCSIYAERPVECRLYPWIITSKPILDFVLHEGCPQHLQAPKPEMPRAVAALPDDWLAEYQVLPTHSFPTETKTTPKPNP